MKKPISRLIGAGFVVAAAAGMLFSLFGLAQIWRIRPAVVKGLTGELDLIHNTVSTTSMGLSAISDTFKTVSGNVEALQTTTVSLGQSIQGAQPMMDTLGKLVGQDLPVMITATRTSIDSAAASALLIDNIMSSITDLPLLGLEQYAPATPLHTALGNVSGSLGKMSPALADMKANLKTAQDNLGNIEIEILRMGSSIEQIKGNLENARQVIIQYQQESKILLTQVETARNRLSGWITSLAIFLSLALIWLFINQIELFFKGWELLFPDRKPLQP
jgi:hypothetical protein